MTSELLLVFMKLLLLPWFGFNFDLLSSFVCLLPNRCGIFMGVREDEWGEGQKGIPIIPSFRFTEHFAIMSDLLLNTSIKLSMNMKTPTENPPEIIPRRGRRKHAARVSDRCCWVINLYEESWLSICARYEMTKKVDNLERSMNARGFIYCDNLVKWVGNIWE